MGTVTFLALLRGALWTILLYVGIRHRSIPSLIVVALAWATNALLAADLPKASGVASVVFAAVVIYLLIDRLDKSPEHIKHVATQQITDARHELHDALNDARAWEARYRAADRALHEHGIRL